MLSDQIASILAGLEIRIKGQDINCLAKGFSYCMESCCRSVQISLYDILELHDDWQASLLIDHFVYTFHFKGERILRLAEICRKLETEEEKVSFDGNREF